MRTRKVFAMLDRQEMLFLDFLVIVTKHVNNRNTQKGLVFYVFNNLRYVFNNLRYVFNNLRYDFNNLRYVFNN